MRPATPSTPGLVLGFLALATWSAPAFEVAAQDRSADPRMEQLTADLRPGGEGEPRSLEERMDELAVPAVSVALVDSGRIAWSRAWGTADLESGLAATPETLFQAASISKAVTALGVLGLVEEGALELDAPANGALSGWRIPEHRWSESRPVTIRHLLTHTGGLTVHGFPGYAPGAPLPTVVEILDGTGPANTPAVRVDQEPGSAWRYSGGGTTVLQLVLEEVTGEPFEEWMERAVLRPLGMESSAFAQPLPRSRWVRAATGYSPGRVPVPGSWHVYPERAAAGLWTTPTDLARWIIALQRSYEGKGSAPLTAATAEEMLTAGAGDWGLGLAVTGSGSARRFSHGGSNRGFRAIVVGWTQGGRGVAIMTNGQRGGTLIEELLDAIARAYGWEDTP